MSSTADAGKAHHTIGFEDMSSKTGGCGKSTWKKINHTTCAA